MGESERDRGRLMQAVDAVNDRWGRGVLKVASGRLGAAPRAWGMKQDRKSPDYTASWDEMPVAKA
jgi:DNA polymerase V